MLTSLAASTLFLVLIVLGSARAQPQGSAPHPRAEPRGPGSEVVAVNTCVREVRQVQPAERFDAHVGLNGQIRPVGSEAAIDRFKLCLQHAGYRME